MTVTAGNPLVSVVIAVHNGREFIMSAVESALSQDYEPKEVIVVDDGSDDGTSAVLDKLGGKITCLRRERSGTSPARNAGIMAAKGEFIAILDADDRWLPGKLRKQVALMLSDPGMGLAYTDYSKVKDGKVISSSLFSWKKPCRGMAYAALLEDNCIGCSTVLIRRSCLDECGMFEEGVMGWAQEYDLWFRLARRFRVDYVDEPLVEYTVHDGGITQKDPAYNDIVHIAIYRKHLGMNNGNPEVHHLIVRKMREKYYRVSRLTYASGEYVLAWDCLLKSLDLPRRGLKTVFMAGIILPAMLFKRGGRRLRDFAGLRHMSEK